MPGRGSGALDARCVTHKGLCIVSCALIFCDDTVVYMQLVHPLRSLSICHEPLTGLTWIQKWAHWSDGRGPTKGIGIGVR